jgi:hypothetical protein
MNSIAVKIAVIFKLGIINVLTVIFYRILVRTGCFKRSMPVGGGYAGDFFKETLKLEKWQRAPESEKFFIARADDLLKGNVPFFSNRSFYLGNPPDWFLNPINGKRIGDTADHWSSLREFDTGAGDIKCVWEASRFSWTVIFAKAYRLSSERKYLDALNGWISDWTTKNPVNMGPNWKCGQEAAIRLMNFLLVAFMLEQDESPFAGALRFVEEHCGRIEPTLYYAIAQDNNHGTSEAAALFTGGAWLASHAGENKEMFRRALRWEKKGRYWLEKRVKKLIFKDGSFSQYSVNYHRLVLDTLSLVKLWQERLGRESFSEDFLVKVREAVIWLFQMTDRVSGDAPNIGGNDGAHLVQLAPCVYRDHRPQVQLASVLFFKKRAFQAGVWDEAFIDLGLAPSKDGCFSQKESRFFGDGGYVTLASNSSWATARIGRYRYRPAHADALHFDLWYNGRNILRDAGSYSYNSDEPLKGYFSGTKSHNTSEFDGMDQMPRLSRFLWGAWTKGKTVTPLSRDGDAIQWSGTYKDHRGCRHTREIKVCDDIWKITDHLSGFKEKAVLRWRLEPGDWRLMGTICRGKRVEIEIMSEDPEIELKLAEGWESRHYMEKTTLPVLEIMTKSNPSQIITEIRFLDV